MKITVKINGIEQTGDLEEDYGNSVKIRISASDVSIVPKRAIVDTSENLTI